MIETVCIVLLLVGLFLFMRYKNNVKNLEKNHENVPKEWTIAGLSPTNSKEGNLPDIAKAGSFHEFLVELHDKYGELASFWMGEERVVSTASPNMFKATSRLFDRPEILFLLFKPIIGQESIQYANGHIGKTRRTYYDKLFSYDITKGNFGIIQECGEEFTTKWMNKPKDEHIPLRQELFPLVMKSVLRSLFGQFFNDDEQIKKMSDAYHTCWHLLEDVLKGIPLTEETEKQVQRGTRDMRTFLAMAIQVRKEMIKQGCIDSYRLVDAFIESDFDDTTTIDDAITFFIGGLHTTALFLVWCLYFLSTHTEEQEKIYQEIAEVLGNEEISIDCMEDLKYTKQAIKETLRCSISAPYAARNADMDIELDGHTVPAKTPIVQALGVVLKDKELWPNPDRFDPTRFDPDKISKMSSFAFMPFGFAGKRQCPAFKSSYIGQTLFLALILKKFKLDIVPGQEVVPDYGLITNLKEEVWITITQRK